MYISVPCKNINKLKNLSGKTVYVYLLMRSKLRYKKGQKGKLIPVNDVIKFTYAEAKAYGIDSKLFSKSLNILFKAGLIQITERGVYGGRTPTLYQVF